MGGIFHSTTYVLVVLALWLFWRIAHRSHLYWSTRLIWGSILLGWGIFNVVEGIVDHEILGLHHVNETMPRADWIWWDGGFLAWGAVMLIVGWALLRAGRQQQAREAAGSANA